MSCTARNVNAQSDLHRSLSFMVDYAGRELTAPDGGNDA